MNTQTEQNFNIKMQQEIETAEYDCRILLGEDDMEMRKMLAWSLRKEGFNVTECSDGDCLLRQLGFLNSFKETKKFDLIISDIRMPGITGMQILEGTNRYEGFPPIILITAFGDEATHARAKELGASVVIDKPFYIDDLLVIISQIIPFNQSSTDIQNLSFKETACDVQFPMTITFRHDCGSGHVRDFIKERAIKLNHFDSFIHCCHVMINQPKPEKSRKHRSLVTVTLVCAGKTMVATHNSDKGTGHDNLYLVIQIAFDKLYRQIRNYHKKFNNKHHPSFTEGEQIS